MILIDDILFLSILFDNPGTGCMEEPGPHWYDLKIYITFVVLFYLSWAYDGVIDSKFLLNVWGVGMWFGIM